jgi:hypothetical protein
MPGAAHHLVAEIDNLEIAGRVDAGDRDGAVGAVLDVRAEGCLLARGNGAAGCLLDAVFSSTSAHPKSTKTPHTQAP